MSQNPKKKNKRQSPGGGAALGILLALLLAAAMGGVSYGVYRLLYKAPTRSDPAPTQAPVVTPAPEQSTAAPMFTPEPTPLHVHLWKEATCTEPRTCQSCGEIDGEPLGHEPSEADYWTPSRCLRCGEELSPPVTPDFELHEMNVNMDQNMTMNYYTVCANDPSKVTVGQAVISRYSVMKSSKKIASIMGNNWVLPEKEGYEWRFLELEILFNDYNAQYFGFNIRETMENYYEMADHSVKPDFNALLPTPDPNATPTPTPNPLQVISEDHNNATHVYTQDALWVEENCWYEYNFVVEYQGQSYICTRVYDGALSGWEQGSNTFHYATAVQVPVGFDGCVFCLYDARHGMAPADWHYFYEAADQNTLYFRLS